MIRLRTQATVWVLAVLLAGCMGMSPAPETNNERMALMLTSYGAVLDTAVLYANENRLTDAQKTKLSGTFDKIEAGLVLAQAALDVADQGAFDSNARIITSGLSVIRTLLTEVQ